MIPSLTGESKGIKKCQHDKSWEPAVSVSVTCLCWSLAHAEQLLFSCVSSKVSICNYVTCHMSHFNWNIGPLTLSLSDSANLSLSPSLYLSLCQSVTLWCHAVICQVLMLITGTCWTTFVFMSMLRSHCLWWFVMLSCCDVIWHICHMANE